MEYKFSGTAEDQTLVIGSGAFIPGFEEQLVGKVPNETADISSGPRKISCTWSCVRTSCRKIQVHDDLTLGSSH